MNNKNKFKKGDRVRISKRSEYYGDSKSSANPKDVEGVVTNYERYEDGSCSRFTTSVTWDNGAENTYRDKDLVLVAEETSLTVDKEFVMQAYESACSTWKAKIEQQFPELFPKQKFATLTDETPYASTLYYKANGKHRPLKYNIALIDGIAGQFGIPTEAKRKGIYVNDNDGALDLELVKVEGGYAILFKLKD